MARTKMERKTPSTKHQKTEDGKSTIYLYNSSYATDGKVASEINAIVGKNIERLPDYAPVRFVGLKPLASPDIRLYGIVVDEEKNVQGVILGHYGYEDLDALIIDNVECALGQKDIVNELFKNCRDALDNSMGLGH